MKCEMIDIDQMTVKTLVAIVPKTVDTDLDSQVDKILWVDVLFFGCLFLLCLFSGVNSFGNS